MEIEKNIPIPERSKFKTSNGKNIFCQLQVGDSFLYGEYNHVNTNRASVAIAYYKKALGRKFIQRKTDEGLRIWRVTPPPIN